MSYDFANFGEHPEIVDGSRVDRIVFVYLIGAVAVSILVGYMFYQVMVSEIDPGRVALFDALRREGRGRTHILGDSSRCACCGRETKTLMGGCGHFTCDSCYVQYKPLPERCEQCYAFYCYRRLRGMIDEEWELTDKIQLTEPEILALRKEK